MADRPTTGQEGRGEVGGVLPDPVHGQYGDLLGLGAPHVVELGDGPELAPDPLDGRRPDSAPRGLPASAAGRSACSSAAVPQGSGRIQRRTGNSRIGLREHLASVPAQNFVVAKTHAQVKPARGPATPDRAVPPTTSDQERRPPPSTRPCWPGFASENRGPTLSPGRAVVREHDLQSHEAAKVVVVMNPVPQNIAALSSPDVEERVGRRPPRPAGTGHCSHSSTKIGTAGAYRSRPSWRTCSTTDRHPATPRTAEMPSSW